VTTTSLPVPFGITRIGTWIVAPDSRTTSWSRTPSAFRSTNRILAFPAGPSAIHSPFTSWIVPAAPDAHRGRFSGFDANA
jgi:hypothetical protein